jgi:CRISPR-associated protein (TIGR03986 family)
VADGFHNPYNFIAPLPRDRAQGTELGDRRPWPHGRYHDNLWTGGLLVRMTTVTPLLLLDHGGRRGGDREHKEFPVRLLDDQRPYVAPTAVKGMLRSAYETVTNSRFGVFTADRTLGYRRETQTALTLEPVRIANGSIQILQAARLPYYPRAEATDSRGRIKRGVEPLRCADTGALLRHDEDAWAVVTRNTVRAIARRDLTRLRGVKGDVVHGWAYVTGRNIDGKGYERFVYEPRRPVDPIPLDENPHVKKRWCELMADAMEANRSSADQEPDRPERSLHLREDGAGIRNFQQPLLAWAERRGGTVVALYPVLVSRGMYDRPPVDFLDETLRPADALDLLSPADRVFGWVAKGEGGGHRGQLRVTPVEPGSGSQPVSIAGGLTLAILSGPKPQQARFYLGQRDQFEGSVPQPSGSSKAAAGYGEGRWAKTLRGRKVYPHQRDLERVDWSRPTAEGREYLGGARSDQNMTVDGWVAPGAEFTFSIEVTNLSDVELGALVWLLTQDDLCFKLGAGKPLGFGSVRLALVETELARGAGLADRYRASGQATRSPQPDPSALGGAFEAELRTAYGRPARELPFMAGFLVAGRGLEGAVHYPRLTSASDPDGESFKWFVENDSGLKLSLPSLVGGELLPFSPGIDRREASSGRGTGPASDAGGRHGNGGRRPRR